MPRSSPTFLSGAIAAVLFAGFAVPCNAAGLGVPELRSHLGEPLRLVVPLRIAPGEGFSDDCVRVVPARESEGGVPPVYGARARVNRGGERNEVIVTTAEPMQEPVLRVVVEVGCTASISREFTMLLDPPINAASTLPGTVDSDAPTSPQPSRRPASPTVTARNDAGDATPRARTPRPARPVRAPAATNPVSPPATLPLAAQTAPSQPATRTPAAPTPRMRLEDPAATAASAGTPPTPPLAAAAVPAAGATTPVTPQPSAQEVELINKLTALGEQIELLKRQVAEQSALNAQLRDQQSQAVPTWMMYLLAAIALAALLFAWRMSWRMRRMQRSVPTHAWWAETRLRTDPATIVKAGAASTEGPASVIATQAGPVVSQADAEREVFYPNGTRTDPSVRLDARFARTNDSRIEVEELGATQAMKVLGETNVHMAITSGFEPAVRASDAANRTEGDGIHSLDFDLGEPTAVAPSAEIPAVDIPLDPIEPVISTASTEFVPLALKQPSNGPMSWIEARQVQTYLRQTADAIEQADAYLSAGQSESAASVLRRLIQDKEGTPRAPWLMLMQIYRKTDKRDAYDGLIAKFSTQFGRTPPPWELGNLKTIEPGLDSDPQLLQAIWAKWGSAESMTLLSQLLYDREATDEAFFNLTLQRDLLNFVKICPLEEG